MKFIPHNSKWFLNPSGKEFPKKENYVFGTESGIEAYDNDVEEFLAQLVPVREQDWGRLRELAYKSIAKSPFQMRETWQPIPDHNYEADVEGEIETVLSEGWVPTYNDPDNIGCAPNAEPIEQYRLTDKKESQPIETQEVSGLQIKNVIVQALSERMTGTLIQQAEHVRDELQEQFTITRKP